MVHERVEVAAGRVVVGVDEVGRGALAGPVAVGAVVVSGVARPPEGLDDSKVLRPAARAALVGPITQWASAVAVGWASAFEIDEWGLRVALAVAGSRALDALSVRPDVALVDGTVNLLRAPRDRRLGSPAPHLDYQELECRTVVRGDAACASIAAASVVAKVARDALMTELDAQHPAYGWRQNKGYGAPEHLAALRRCGPTPQHRQTWRLPGVGSAAEAGPPGPSAFGREE
ncbi:MAG: ribonuclease HII [Acidobacteriota bacterium]|nr:ribonuclease HII [Acidobacteriota bacterium]